jgi:four helix bundle protein
MRTSMNTTTVAKGNQLERRLISFAAAVLALSTKLPRTPQGRHVCGQILRSGTLAAANYGEARGAESRADFIHKLKVVFKELNETTIWLEVIAESSLISRESIIAIVAENRELCRIYRDFDKNSSHWEWCEFNLTISIKRRPQLSAVSWLVVRCQMKLVN